MTPEKLESIRDELDVGQEEMAELLQCDYTSYKRYATGARPVPRYIFRSALLWLFIHRNGLKKKVEKHLADGL